MSPPVAKRLPTTTVRHGRTVTDDWAWMADHDDPDLRRYLEAENAYAAAWFGDHDGLVEELFGEIKSRTKETDLSVPVRKGQWWYLTRTEEGKSYRRHVRRLVGAADEDPPLDDSMGTSAEERLLLDENEEAEGHPFFGLGAFDVSPSGALLAWAADVTGGEVFTLRVRELASGQDLPDVLEGASYGTAWSTDERHLFYVRPDEALRPYQVWRHELGRPQADDALVYEELDERFFIGLGLTRSEQLVVMASDSRTTSEVRVLPAGTPLAAPVVVEPRRADHEYAVDDHGDRLVILTNLEAEDFRVVTAPKTSPGQGSWEELVGYRPGRRISDVDAFAGFIVLQEWDEAVPRLRIVFDDHEERVPRFAEPVHAVDLADNPEYATDVLRFEFESLATPRSVYEEGVRGGERRLLKQTPVLGVDLTAYVSERLWATADDGTRVPVDVVRHRDTPVDGTAPGVLYGYGAYEVSLAPWFSIPRLSLLDRGVVWALAHPRGGGELGRRWYREGKLLAKRNSFTDFLACGRHLAAAGFVAPGRLAARGGSAGGLLVAAAATIDPGAFAAVVAEVPFVDVVNTLLDPSLPLTVTEWEEWGDPRNADYDAYLTSYAPYENVDRVAYPPMLVTAGLNDPRVAVHEPAKWVARLRATAEGREPLLLRTELDSGHAGPSGRYEAWREEARVLAFLLAQLGATR